MARIPYENWKINHLCGRRVVKKRKKEKVPPIFKERMPNTFRCRCSLYKPPPHTPVLQPPSFTLSVRLFAENVNEHGNNQAICLHVANFITVNDLYQPMPTSLCLITTKRIDMGGSDSGGLNTTQRAAGTTNGLRNALAVVAGLLSFGSEPGSLRICHTRLSTADGKNCGTERAVSRKGEPKKREGRYY